MAASLEHPFLGTVRGTENRDVVQYLGIPYATLAHRFAAPIVKSDYAGGVDATKHGPTVLAPPVGHDIEFGLIQKELDKPTIPPVSDLEGLNLNITVPAGLPVQSTAGHPVLVFIHGGGFLFGGNWAPHYDLGNLVAFATLKGKPIVAVSINYRLGAPGFLDSAELRAAGLPRNRGLLDQKTALQWVSQNIAGFGGDPKQVTVVGQSAGGGSVTHLFDLIDDVTLFNRAVSMSGSKLSAAVIPASVAQAAYKSVLGALDIEPSLTPDEQVSQLIAQSPENVLSKIPLSVPMGPVVEDSVFPSFTSLQESHHSKRSVPFMIGSTSFDGGIFEILGLFANRNDDDFITEFSNIFIKAIDEPRQVSARKLLGHYGLLPDSEQAVDVAAAKISILQLATDIKYFTAAKAYAESWPEESWLYYFQEPNPWEGPNKGRSTHVQDVAYLFLNYRQFMDPEQVKVAEAFAADVIDFAYGQAPWPNFQAGGQMRVYGPSGGEGPSVSTLHHHDAGPSREMRALWDEIGLDELSKGWNAYFLR